MGIYKSIFWCQGENILDDDIVFRDQLEVGENDDSYQFILQYQTDIFKVYPRKGEPLKRQVRIYKSSKDNSALITGVTVERDETNRLIPIALYVNDKSNLEECLKFYLESISKSIEYEDKQLLINNIDNKIVNNIPVKVWYILFIVVIILWIILYNNF